MANRKDLRQMAFSVTGELLREKGYFAFVDVLMGMNRLSKKDYEDWRFRRVPCLEKVIHLNLSQLNFLLKELRSNCEKGQLKASQTAYCSWGKRKKRGCDSLNPAIQIWKSSTVLIT